MSYDRNESVLCKVTDNGYYCDLGISFARNTIERRLAVI